MGTVAGLVAAIVLLSLAPGFAGQAPAARPGAAGVYVPPRTPDGQPDMQGMWLPGGEGLPMERASIVAPAPAAGGDGAPAPAGGGRGGGGRGGAGPRPTMIVDPPDGKVPFQPWALARRAEIIDNQDKFEFVDPRVRCLPAGVPRVNLPIVFNTYQILQTPGHVVFLYEWSHLYRDIPLDGRPHVDSTNFTDKTHLLGNGAPPVGVPAGALTGGQGVFHSEALHVVERFTMANANTIAYEATLEDPKVFTRPFKIAWNAFQRAPKDHQLYEYACFEGDHDTVRRMTGVDIDPSLNVGGR